MMNNFKRYTINVILVSILGTSCLAKPVDAIEKIPARIGQPTRNFVDLHRKRITTKLIRNRYERIGVMCATTAVIAAGGWYSFKPGEVVSKTAEVVPLTVDSNQLLKKIDIDNQHLKFESQQIKSILESLVQSVDLNGISQDVQSSSPSLVDNQSYLGAMASGLFWYSKKMGKAALDNIVLLVLVGGLPGPINKLFGFWGRKIEDLGTHVYHDADFHWFVTAQTKAVPYFNDLERAAELLPLASDKEERQHQISSMLWTANVLVKELARIVAFMEYQAEKLKALNTGCSIQMLASAKYVYRHIDQFAQTLQSMLEDSTKHAEIPAYIKSFRETIRSEQDGFCVNEHAALYDISDTIA